jgi:hypothetical protein
MATTRSRQALPVLQLADTSIQHHQIKLIPFRTFGQIPFHPAKSLLLADQVNDSFAELTIKWYEAKLQDLREHLVIILDSTVYVDVRSHALDLTLLILVRTEHDTARQLSLKVAQHLSNNPADQPYPNYSTTPPSPSTTTVSIQPLLRIAPWPQHQGRAANSGRTSEEVAKLDFGMY